MQKCLTLIKVDASLLVVTSDLSTCHEVPRGHLTRVGCSPWGLCLLTNTDLSATLSPG
jgi:hypothetical protein